MRIKDLIMSRKKKKKNKVQKSRSITLQFTPYAWGKVVYINSLTSAETGAFGVSNAKNPMLVEDIRLIKQKVTCASVEFDDEDIADYFLDQVEAGLKPEQFARIWIHTHPNWGSKVTPVVKSKWANSSPSPSQVDEDTFADAFGNCNWSVMFIYGGGENCYARLSLRKAKKELLLDVKQSEGDKPTEADEVIWKAEFDDKVTEPTFTYGRIYQLNKVCEPYEPYEPYVPYNHNYIYTPKIGFNGNLATGVIASDIDEQQFATFLENHSIDIKDFRTFSWKMQEWWKDEYRAVRALNRQLMFAEDDYYPYY